MNNTKRIAGLGVVACLLALASNSMAQGICPSAVQQVMNSAGNLCAKTASDQVCYGNQSVTVQPANAAFSAPGALMDVANIQSLQVSGAGAAIMKVLPKGLAGTSAGQFVNIVVFGNVTINPVNNGGQPMQAFYFSTEIGNPISACQGIPVSGITLQNPTHQKAQFVANGVQMSIGSTVLLQAPGVPLKVANARQGTATQAPTAAPTKALGTTATHQMKITVLRGSVDLTAGGKTTTVKTGQQSSVALTDDDQPEGPPEPPVDVNTLPPDEQSAVSLVQEESDAKLLDPFSTPEATDITDQSANPEATDQTGEVNGTGQAEVTDTPEPQDTAQPQDTPENSVVQPTDVPANDTGSSSGGSGSNSGIDSGGSSSSGSSSGSGESGS